MAINNRKLGWNCDSDREKRKYNSKNTHSDMAFSSMGETTGLEIQTKDIGN